MLFAFPVAPLGYLLSMLLSAPTQISTMSYCVERAMWYECNGLSYKSNSTLSWLQARTLKPVMPPWGWLMSAVALVVSVPNGLSDSKAALELGLRRPQADGFCIMQATKWRGSRVEHRIPVHNHHKAILNGDSPHGSVAVPSVPAHSCPATGHKDTRGSC